MGDPPSLHRAPSPQHDSLKLRRPLTPVSTPVLGPHGPQGTERGACRVDPRLKTRRSFLEFDLRNGGGCRGPTATTRVACPSRAWPTSSSARRARWPSTTSATFRRKNGETCDTRRSRNQGWRRLDLRVRVTLTLGQDALHSRQLQCALTHTTSRGQALHTSKLRSSSSSTLTHLRWRAL